jgi:cell division inhibitor SepF
MAGIFKKAMEALGLDEGDSYGDYDYEAPAPQQRRPPRDVPGRDTRDRGDRYEPRDGRDQRDSRDGREGRQFSDEGGTIVHPKGDVRSQPSGDGGVVGVAPQPRTTSGGTGTVRTMSVPKQNSFHLAEPTEFADVKDFGERFRSSQPVIINLTSVSRDQAHRILDFASGLIFGLNGEIKKVADRVFMLTPANYEVSADQKRQLQEKGLNP